MVDWITPPEGAAEDLLRNATLEEVLLQIEKEAWEDAVSAHPEDDLTRLLSTERARTIRSVVQELTERASGKAKPEHTDAPA